MKKVESAMSVYASGARPIKREYALLGLLALMWGSSSFFIALALESFGPITLMALRVGIALGVLALIMRAKGMRLWLPKLRTCAHLYCLALMNSILAWPLLSWGQQYVDSSLATVLNAMTPLFVVLLTFIVGSERNVSRASVLGVLIGLFGVAIIVGANVPSMDGNLLAQLACVLSAACYAVVALYKKPFEHLSGLEIATHTMLFACLTLTPIALVVEEIRPITARAVMSLIALSIFSTAFSVIIFFRLQRTIGALGVSSQSYLRVVVGVGLGVLFLGEALTAAQIAGSILVLLSLGLIHTLQRVKS